MNRFLSRSLLLLALAGPAALAQTLYVPSGTVGSSTTSGVGIGTSSPNALLSLAGSDLTTQQMSFRSSDQNWFGRIGQNVNGASIGLLVSSGGAWSLNGSTFSATKDFNGAFPSAALAVMNQYNGALTTRFSFLRKAGGSTQSDGAVTEMLVIDGSGNVGIGTTNPTSKLMVTHSSQLGFYAGFWAPALTIQNTDTSAYNASQIVIKDPTGLDTAGFTFSNLANGASGASNFGLVLRNNGTLFIPLLVTNTGNVGIGTTNPTYPLSVHGTIQAQEVIVQTGWSDYVFQPEYRLAPLHEVEKTIATEGHLPGIPSAKEVAEHGISVGEMQAKLLAKIEELTLHQIAQEKEQAQLRERVNQLEKENSSLRTTLDTLHTR